MTIATDMETETKRTNTRIERIEACGREYTCPDSRCQCCGSLNFRITRNTRNMLMTIAVMESCAGYHRSSLVFFSFFSFFLNLLVSRDDHAGE
jgi:hypothetical protein